jgi:hypothetical protein
MIYFLRSIWLLNKVHKGSCHSNHFDREGVPCKIGRKVSVKTQPESGNGYFDAKVLSRTHGEITLDKNAVGVTCLN